MYADPFPSSHTDSSSKSLYIQAMASRPIITSSSSIALPDFTQETDLALARFGGQIVFATDGML